MSQTSETVLGWLARKWRDWSRRRRTMMALDCCGPAETTRMALDIGVSETDFRALAGRWPGSDLLSQRMHQINLDAGEIARVEPDVTRDLPRHDVLHDAGRDDASSSWRIRRRYLKERYARGEINQMEFEERLRAITR